MTLTDATTAVSVSGFSVTDVDLSGDGGLQSGESDFIQVTIRLLDGEYNPLPQSAYADVILAISAAFPFDFSASAAASSTWDSFMSWQNVRMNFVFDMASL